MKKIVNVHNVRMVNINKIGRQNHVIPAYQQRGVARDHLMELMVQLLMNARVKLLVQLALPGELAMMENNANGAGKENIIQKQR